MMLALLLALPGCVQLRLFTYPSEFVYLDEQGVQDAMHRMAASLGALDRLVVAENEQPGDPARQAAIREELRRLDALASALDVGSALEVGGAAVPKTNHLLIDEHIDAFLADVDRARRFASREPPSYYPIGTLVGGCGACHAER